MTDEGEVGSGCGGGTGLARGRRGHRAREEGWGNAAGAVRLGVRRANEWRACGVERGGSLWQISSRCHVLSRDLLHSDKNRDL